MAFNDYRPAWKVPDLTPTQRLVLLALAEHRNERNDLCCPGYSTLATETGLARGTISEAIKALIEKGTISIEQKRSKRFSNHYHFQWNETAHQEDSDCSLDEQSVRQENTVFAERIDGSPDEHTVRPVDRNIETNSEPNQKSKRVSRTQQPAAEYDRALTAQATVLAQNFWRHLGCPAKWKPESWVKPFSKLLHGYNNPDADLEPILSFVFEIQPSGKWRERLLNPDVKAPAQYFIKIIPLVVHDYTEWLAEQPVGAFPEPPKIIMVDYLGT
jgi:Helix-turn-helix domain